MMRCGLKRALSACRLVVSRTLGLFLAASIGTLGALPARAATPATAGVFVPHGLTLHLKNHAATLLRDGTVLITGGIDNSNNVQNAAAIYNPATGITKILANHMTSAREGHTATLLSDGRVLIAGGDTTGGAPVSSAELYTPSTHTFGGIGSPMSEARAFHSATLLPNGIVLLVGGVCGTSCNGGNSFNGVSFTADIFDPTGQSFSASGSTLTVQRKNHTATLLNDGTVLILGGNTNSSSLSPTSKADIYTPNGDSFNQVGNMNDSRSSHTATLLNNSMVLITGGASGNNPMSTTNALPSAELYNPDPSIQSFTQLSAVMSDSRVSHTATLLQDGSVLIAGGQDDTLTALASAEIFDPIAKTFTGTAADMDVARTQLTATSLVDGTVLLVGGATAAADALQLDLFDGTPGSFVPTGPMTEPRQFHSATMVQDGTLRIFLAGGQNAVMGPLASTEYYDGAGFTAGQPLNLERSLHTATAFKNGATYQILIAGGVTSFLNGWVTPKAEIYAPIAGGVDAPPVATKNIMTFAPAGRFGHTATLLNNGDILIAGGENANGIVQNSTDLFVPDGAGNGSFNLTRALKGNFTMKAARAYHAAIQLCDHTVLVTGGRDGNGNYLAGAEIYDPIKDVFTATASGKTGGLLTARAFHRMTLLSDCSVLIAGGVNSKGVVTATERYVPAVTVGTTKTAAAFVAAPPLNTGRDLHTATFLSDGTVLVTGGESGSTTVTNTAEIYNPFLQTWTPTVGPMLSGRFGHAAVQLMSGFVLLTGGEDSTFAVTAGSELYDPPSGPQPGGAYIAATQQNKKGGAKHIVKAGILRISNMSNLFQTVSGVTLALSNPALFSSITLTSSGVKTTLTIPGATSDLVFASPVTLEPGESFKLTFSGKLAIHEKHQTSAQTVTGLGITNSLGQAASLGLPASLSTVTEN